jgi:hypothetical protein
MGGALRRPRNGFEKIGTSGFGVFIQLRSNSFYQKFLKNPMPAAHWAAGRKTRRLAGQKFPPQKPLHFLPARF